MGLKASSPPFCPRPRGGADGAPPPQATVHFDAPYLVHYLTRLGEDGGHARFTGLALYALPLDEDRCRLLYRAYGTEFPAEVCAVDRLLGRSPSALRKAKQDPNIYPLF